MAVEHVGEADRRIFEAGDVHEAGARREHGLLARAAMMERVVHEREDARAADVVGRRERRLSLLRSGTVPGSRAARRTPGLGCASRIGRMAGQGGAQGRRLLWRILQHPAFVQRAHDEAGRVLRPRRGRPAPAILARPLLVFHTSNG